MNTFISFSLLSLLLLFSPAICRAEKIIEYGFEDWIGFDGENSPAAGYIFTTPTGDAGGWGDHLSSTIGTTGGINCNGNTAFAGSYYQHVQTSSNHIDPCLGKTADTTNVRDYIGANYSRPLGEHDTSYFGSLLTGDTAVLRFHFRTTDDWSSDSNDVIDAGGGMKFIRWAVGSDVIGDDNNILIKARFDEDLPYPRIGIFDRADNSVTYGTHSVNWQDGDWHSFAVKSVRDENTPGIYQVSIYLDDWNMLSPILVKSTTVPDYGDGFYHRVCLVANWSGVTNIPNLCGMDFDTIEVWNSMPDSSFTRVPTNINHTTYLQNLHSVRQHDGLVRVGNSLFAITPYHSGGRAEIWKSTDNGDTWNSMGYFATVDSAPMIAGADGRVYAFGRYNGYLRMIAFTPETDTLPAPINMIAIGDYNYGGYVTVTATVDEAGRLFVNTHETDTDYPSRDNLVQTTSSDNGLTWSPLQTLWAADSDDGWYSGNCAVSTDNDINCVGGSFQENPREIRFIRSSDHGRTYSGDTLLYSGVMANPHILSVGNNELYVFAQSEDSPVPGRGLVMNYSQDSGLSWTGFRLIEGTCNYFDPTAALADNGDIYVFGRRDNGLGDVGTSCGNSSFMGILKSVDKGAHWTVEQWLDSSRGWERAGSMTKVRYQTWHTGGGQLEWIWMNYDGGGTVTPIFYNSNSTVQIAEPPLHADTPFSWLLFLPPILSTP